MTTDPIPQDELDALAAAVWQAPAACPRHAPALIALLRRLAPGHETLVLLDRRARQRGYVQAGSDELIADAETQP